MKQNKDYFSSKLGVWLGIDVWEELDDTGKYTSTPNIPINVFIITKEDNHTKRRIYQNQYWIPNNEDKYINALNKAVKDCENKFLLDAWAKKKFQEFGQMKNSDKTVDGLKINVDVVVDTTKAKEAVNELLESLKFKLTNLS